MRSSLVAAILLPCALSAAPKTRSVRWTELAGVASGKQVSLIDANTKFEGKVAEVTADAIVIGNGKSKRVMPRASVASLHLIEHRSPFRFVLAILVPVGAAYAATSAGFHEDNVSSAGLLGGAVAIVAAGATGGYYLGRAIDRRVTVITIVQD